MSWYCMLHTFSAGSSDSKVTKPNPEREGEGEGGRERERERERERGGEGERVREREGEREGRESYYGCEYTTSVADKVNMEGSLARE